MIKLRKKGDNDTEWQVRERATLLRVLADGVWLPPDPCLCGARGSLHHLLGCCPLTQPFRQCYNAMEGHGDDMPKWFMELAAVREANPFFVSAKVPDPT